MARWRIAAAVSLLCAMIAGLRPALAGQFDASIDLDYTYSQEHLGDAVNAETTFNQKYEVKYETSLTSAYDFFGAVRLELQDSWYTDAAGTSKVAPTLEMQVKGSQVAAKLVYEAPMSTTDAYLEAGEVTNVSSNLSLDLEVVPAYWPEMKLSFDRKREYQDFASDSTNTTLEFQARKDIYNLRLEFDINRVEDEAVLPERTTGSGTEWSLKASYKEALWGGTEFEFTYEVNESHTVEKTRGVFVSETEDYVQKLRTRLRKAFDLTPRIALGLAWEYEFEQDLLALAYDYKFKNRYVLDLRWDFNDWLKIDGEARRETDHTEAIEGLEDEGTVDDTVRAGFDLTLIDWLRFAGKAELTWNTTDAALSGGSPEHTDTEKYELIAKNVWGDFWDLVLNTTTDIERTNGWVTSRGSKFKAELKLRWEDLIVSPSYEVGRDDQWPEDVETPDQQQKTEDAKIRIEYKANLADRLLFGFSHEYGVKVTDTLDEVLSFEHTLEFREATKLDVGVDELIRDLDLKGSIERTASDTEDDADPQVVDVAYTLDANWNLEDLVVTSSFKYNDKGDTFDDLSFNLKVGWRYERLELTGEYQFDKTYAETTEENRKLKLKLNYRF